MFVKAHAMSRTINDDPLQKFKFRVTIPGIPTTVGFQKVNGLTREIEVVEYIEGMFDTAHKLTGREKVGEITLERGMFSKEMGGLDMEDFFKITLITPETRNTVVIEYLDRYDYAKRTYTLAECWASKWEASDMDASSSDVSIEKMVLQFEKFV